MSMNNLPTPQQGEVDAKVCNGEAIIRNPSGFIVKTIRLGVFDTQIEQYIANEIAIAINEARNIGFEQGRAHVRRALGLQNN